MKPGDLCIISLWHWGDYGTAKLRAVFVQRHRELLDFRLQPYDGFEREVLVHIIYTTNLIPVQHGADGSVTVSVAPHELTVHMNVTETLQRLLRKAASAKQAARRLADNELYIALIQHPHLSASLARTIVAFQSRPALVARAAVACTWQGLPVHCVGVLHRPPPYRPRRVCTIQ